MTKKTLGIGLALGGVAALFLSKAKAAVNLEMELGLPKEVKLNGDWRTGFITWRQPLLFTNRAATVLNVDSIRIDFYPANTQTLVGSAQRNSPFQIPAGDSVVWLLCTLSVVNTIATLMYFAQQSGIRGLSFDAVGSIGAEGGISVPVNQRIDLNLSDYLPA